MDPTDLADTAMADSTMMDPTMDDLFGDPGDALNVALPPAPLPTATILRIAEMQSRGCCTRLAWSSTGSIAQISADGTRVIFRSFIRDSKTAEWSVSEGSQKHSIHAPEGRKFVHVQFSGIGIDLAVLDNLGAAYLYTLTGALGRMIGATGGLSRVNAVKSELDAVVGLRWLQMYPTEFKGPCFEPAVKNGDTWDFPMKQRDQKRAHHPSEGRNAILHVSRSSELTLLYQNGDQGWQSTSIVLHVIASSDQLVSHADIGEDGDDLLVVTHDYSSKLRLYRITIIWNGTQHSRAPNVVYTLVAPTLEVHHLTALDHVHAEHAEGAKLTHIRLLPTPSDAAHLAQILPVVVAVFFHAPLPAETNQGQGAFSVITRWQVETTTPALHGSFKRLKPNANTTVARNQLTVLRRQPDTVTDKVILTFESRIFDTVLAFVATDGTVDFRDRTTMQALHFTADTNSVSSLAQTGFEFAAGDHNVLAAITSDGAAIAMMRHDGKLVARPMTFSPGWHTQDDGISDNKAYVSAAEACVAREFAFLAYANASNDESLALLPPDVAPEVKLAVIRHIYRIMNRSPDFSMTDANRHQMFVLKDPLIPRAMSAAVFFGTNPISGDRDAHGQFAFALLSLRGVSTAMAQSLIRANHGSTPIEVFTSLCGVIRWTTNFIIYALDTLTNLKRDMKEKQMTAKQALQQSISQNGNPVIHILLCSFTRTLLRFAVSWTAKYFQIIEAAALPRVRTIAERQDLLSMMELAAQTPFRHQDLDKPMMEIDTAVREAWSKSNVPSDRRAELETAMMCEGALPDELEPAMNALMDSILPRLQDTMDLSKLYFWNVDWLGIANSKPSSAGDDDNHDNSSSSSSKAYDIHRKIPLSRDVPLRLCRRCGSVMEDLAPEKTRELPGWLNHAQRHCVCMNFWILA